MLNINVQYDEIFLLKDDISSCKVIIRVYFSMIFYFSCTVRPLSDFLRALVGTPKRSDNLIREARKYHFLGLKIIVKKHYNNTVTVI